MVEWGYGMSNMAVGLRGEERRGKRIDYPICPGRATGRSAQTVAPV